MKGLVDLRIVKLNVVSHVLVNIGILQVLKCRRVCLSQTGDFIIPLI